jgi:ABC-type phosphonate transport system ATPase subunit
MAAGSAVPMCPSISGRARCWASSAKAARANRRCSELHGRHLAPDSGKVIFDTRADGPTDTLTMSEPERRMLSRTDWAFVHQNPRDGLRMRSARAAMWASG